ncbi:hypothetical protein PO909_001707 [Leuciscus waleckii]
MVALLPPAAKLPKQECGLFNLSTLGRHFSCCSLQDPLAVKPFAVASIQSPIKNISIKKISLATSILIFVMTISSPHLAFFNVSYHKISFSV